MVGKVGEVVPMVGVWEEMVVPLVVEGEGGEGTEVVVVVEVVGEMGEMDPSGSGCAQYPETQSVNVRAASAGSAMTVRGLRTAGCSG